MKLRGIRRAVVITKCLFKGQDRIRTASIGLCILLCGNAAAAGQLSDVEKRGRSLFLTGEVDDHTPIAMIGAGDVRVPATALPCASCHGYDASGRDGGRQRERGIAPPAINSRALAQKLISQAGFARQRPAYDTTLLIRAITLGIDAGGNRLDPGMPRFVLSQQDAASLVAYLGRLGTLPEPGLNDRTIVLGTIPSIAEDPRRLALAAYLAEVNQQSGLFGRNLVLSAGDINDSIFAWLAPSIAGDEQRVVNVATAAGVPMVGPLTLRTQAAAHSRYVFYLDGGIEVEARALAGFASRMSGTPVIVDDGTPL